jgi:hypothetical protein
MPARSAPPASCVFMASCRQQSGAALTFQNQRNRALRSSPAAPAYAASRLRLCACHRGHDTRALQAYLGHRNIQHTVRYTELSPTRFKNFWRE